ncbi:MAG: DUF4956 domain-containing protein [Bacteroidales bacterium]|nr:DUF4956 domain-containing protein [Bacteroidales bacterium]
MIQSDSELFDSSIASEFAGSDGAGLFGIPWFDGPSLWQMLFRFAINLVACWLIVGLLYYRKSRRRDYYFTFMLFSITIFFLIFLMDNVKVQIGFALGLFAIFGMIRYRTETVPIREMTYLFVVVGLSVINGLAMTVSYAELFLTNTIVVLAVWLFESIHRRTHLESKIIVYEKVALAHADRENELIADLKSRTGLDIKRLEVGHIDYLKDIAYVKVYYASDKPENTVNHLTKVKKDNYF